jgi:hypothetical protein
MPEEVKGTVFRENWMGDHKLAFSEQITNFFVYLYLQKCKKVLSPYIENTINNEKKNRKIELSPRIGKPII